MTNTVRCRICRAPKWRTDPCQNADCLRNLADRTVTVTVRSRSNPIAATIKHGFHALNTSGFMQPTCDYDTPISRLQRQPRIVR
jgi:hypothetical protein